MAEKFPKGLVAEWVESPITRAFRAHIEARITAAYHNRAQCFHWGDAVKTQESRAYMLGAEAELDLLSEFLGTGNFDLLEVEEIKESENEQVGNLPSGGEGSGEAGYH